MLAELRALLSAAPSRLSFQAICEFVEKNRTDSDLGIALEYAKQHLEAWDWEFMGMDLQLTGVWFDPVPAWVSLVRYITLKYCEFSADLSDLLVLPVMSELRGLRVEWDQHGRWVGNLIAECSTLKNLQLLQLTRAAVCDEGLLQLCQNQSMGNLEFLSIESDWVSSRGMSALVKSTCLKKLRHLSLWNCELGYNGALVLAESPMLAQLEWLELGLNRIGLEGVKALKESPHLNGKVIDVWGSNIEEPAVQITIYKPGETAKSPLCRLHSL